MQIGSNTKQFNPKKIRKILLLTLPILLSCLLGTVVQNQSNINTKHGGRETSLQQQPLTASWLIPAPPISILSDSDWVSGPSRFWVNGSGTWASPFILANLSIDATVGVTCIDIENTGKVFRIVNCTLYNTQTGYYGIRLVTTGNGTLFNNTCTGNPDAQILMNVVTNTTLINNYCTGGSFAIEVFSSNNNTFSGNTYTAGGGNYGIYMGSCANNTIIGNNGHNCYSGLSLITSNRNNVTQNNFTSNTYGIYTDFAANNYITNNNCTGSYDTGIYVYDVSNNNTITGNNCTGNAIYGIELYTSSDNNTLIGNNCSANHYGIFVYLTSNFNNFIGNNCSDNTFDGIRVSSSSNISLTNNVCMRNSIGFDLSTSSNDTLIGNNCSFNTVNDGISLATGTNNTISNNNCTGNLQLGIYLTTISNTTLAGNICQGNDVGIRMDSSSNNNTLTANNCTGNPNGGIILSNSNSAFISNNTCSKDTFGINLDSNSYFSVVCYNWIRKFTSSAIANGNPTNTVFANYISSTVFTAGFTENFTTINFGQYIGFSDTTVGGAVPLTYQWNFGDGTGNSTEQSPIHHYLVGGPQSVILTVTDAEADASVAQVTITVIALPLVAAFTSNASAISVGSYITFTDTTTGGVSPYTYQWNFGDSPMNATTNPVTHQYVSYGIYHVNLTVTDNVATMAVYTMTITVNTLPLVANFTSSASTISAGSSVTFTDTTTGGVSPYTNYMWSWGDGTANGTTTPVSHQYAAYGIYTVTLAVTDNVGNMSGYQMTITVNALPPVAAFTPSAIAVSAGTSVTFTDTTTGGVSPYTYQWNFGDGTTNATTKDVTHVFSTPGTYTVTLTVTDSKGSVAVATSTVTVSASQGNTAMTLYIIIGVIAVAAIVGIVVIVKVKAKKHGSQPPSE